MKRLFVVNLSAGKTGKEKIVEEISEYMSKTGEDYEIFTQDIRKIDPTVVLKEVDHLIAVGGDGTINTCLRLILSTKIRKFSILPTGSGNDFARTMKISKDIHKALEAILKNNVKKLDLGMWNDRPFINIASVGFDADVNEKTNRQVLQRYGSLGFMVSLLSLVFNFKGKKLSFHHKGKEIGGEWAIFTLCNGRYYGGGVPICKEADPTDASLDLLGIKAERFHLILPFFISLFLGKSKLWKKGFYRGKVSQMNFILESPCTVNLDGESHTGFGPVEVKILSGEIEFIG